MSDTLKSWSIEKITRLISGLLKKKHGNARVFSCTCATAAGTQRKDVTCEECEKLENGDIFIVEFTNAQTYNGAPTLQINSLGAKNIQRITGTNAGRYEWSKGETLTFRYNGTHFIISNAGLATTTYYGRTKLYTGAASTSAALALTPASLNSFANGTACPYYSTSKTYEVGDKVRYGNYIYECINAIPTAQAWTAENWEVAPTLQEQITNKADNVQNAIAGNFAGLDANGNLMDSGKSAEDFLEKEYEIGIFEKQWNGLTNFSGFNIWTDGDNVYYSNGSEQYALDKFTSTWNVKTWTGLTYFSGFNIWTDRDNIYYSSGGSSYQYVLDKSTSTWTTKTWTGLTYFSGSNIWTDGENIYFSNYSDHYVLDKSTSTWTTKTWNGLTIFYGDRVWTDGDNIYYTYDSKYYVLDKATSTWNTKTWKGLDGIGGVDGTNIWSDGENIYYDVSSSIHMILDNSTSTWNYKTWNEFDDYISGSNIWTDGENIYCSNGSKHCEMSFGVKKLYVSKNGKYISVPVKTFIRENVPAQVDPLKYEIELDSWSFKTWNGISYLDGRYVWTDGENVYFSAYSAQYVFNRDTSTWSSKVWTGLNSFYGINIWTDGNNIYLSENSSQYILDKSTSTWSTKTWSGLSNFNGNNIWTDGENIYYSSGSDQYVLNKSTSTWSTKTWSELTNFNGINIWTDGENIYYTAGYTYILNKSTSTWTQKTWNGTNVMFGGLNIWTDGKNIYLSEGSNQYVLDKSTSTWSAKTWSGLSNFTGQYIWTDGKNIYYCESSDKQYILIGKDRLLLGKNGKFENISAESVILTYAPKIEVVNNLNSKVSELDQNKIDKSSYSLFTKTWNGLSSYNGQNIWTDGENIYYSYSSSQYVLDKSTSTWNIKTWSGLNSYNGYYVWTDGDNIYYSNGSSQYVLDKSTSTWSAKTWSGLSNFTGEYVWTDGDNVYYSRGSSQYVLNKSTSTWNTKTWSGSSSFYGYYVWTDGENIYYSNSSTQYILDKSTSTWSTKTWGGLSSFLSSFNGQYVWTDGENIYYSSGSSNQYVLDKSTSNWSANTWSGFSNFYGNNNIWTDGDNVYYSSGSSQYIIYTNNTILLASNGTFEPVSVKKFIADNVPDPISKADKVSNATNGNFAGLDADGNLTDSGSKASDFMTRLAVVDLIYPVGSIYMSATSTSPSTLFNGTTWEQLKDRFLLGAGDVYTAGNTGGNASHTLTISEMPSHNHAFTGSTVDTGDESNGHTHDYTDYYATNPSGTAISVAQMPSHNHTHNDWWTLTNSGGVERRAVSYSTNSGNTSEAHTNNAGSTQSHTHTANNTSTTRTSEGISSSHHHSVTASGTVGNSGDGTAFSIMPPYLAVYMWKRTA